MACGQCGWKGETSECRYRSSNPKPDGMIDGKRGTIVWIVFVCDWADNRPQNCCDSLLERTCGTAT